MMYQADKFTGTLIRKNKENENIWVDIEELDKKDVLPIAREFATQSYKNWDKVPYKESEVDLGKF